MFLDNFFVGYRKTKLKKGQFIRSVRIPLFLTEEIVHKAKVALEKDFTPISDMRASGLYRMEIAKNLLEKCCAEIKQKKLIGVYF